MSVIADTELVECRCHTGAVIVAQVISIQTTGWRNAPIRSVRKYESRVVAGAVAFMTGSLWRTRGTIVSTKRTPLGRRARVETYSGGITHLTGSTSAGGTGCRA